MHARGARSMLRMSTGKALHPSTHQGTAYMYFCWGKAAEWLCTSLPPALTMGAWLSPALHTDTVLIIPCTPKPKHSKPYIRNLYPSEALVSTPFPVFYAGPCWAATISLMMVMASLARPSRCSMDATCIASAIATERPWVEFGTR